MELAVVNKIVALSKPEPGEDTSSQWWLTLKVLRKLGFRADHWGKGIAVFLCGGGDDIIRDSDARIETFLYDARNVVGIRNGSSDTLSSYQRGLAFSVEMYANRRSYEPMYGFVPLNGDPVELAKSYLFLLQELAKESKLPALQTSMALESGDVLGIAKRLA